MDAAPVCGRRYLGTSVRTTGIYHASVYYQQGGTDKADFRLAEDCKRNNLLKKERNGNDGFIG